MAVPAHESIKGPYRTWHSVDGEKGSRQRPFCISAAHDEWNHLAIPLVAMARGFFAQEGLSHVELLATGEEEAQVTGVEHGWIDLAVDPLTSMILSANDQGKPVYIGGSRRKGHTFHLYGAKDIRQMEDLMGKRVIIGTPNGATDIQFREILRRFEMEPDKDVEFVYHGAMHDMLQTLKLLEEGKGEAIMVSVSFARHMDKAGYPQLVDGGQFFAPRQDRVTAVSDHALQERFDAVVSCLRGMMHAAKVVIDPRERDAIRKLVQASGFPTEEPEDRRRFDELMDSLYGRIDPTFTLPIEGLTEIVKECQRDGLLSSSFELKSALRLDALKVAQGSSGP